MPNSSYLVIVDADRIHDYVFAPQQLRLIRGGSAIQVELNRRKLLQELLDMELGKCNVDPATLLIMDAPTLESDSQQAWEAIYAGGGTALVLFRDWKRAADYAAKAEELFLDHTATATASSAFVESQDGFRDTYLKVRSCLESAKTARAEHHFLAATPYWKVCDCCGRLPAARRLRDLAGERYPCAACMLRLKESEKVKAPFLDDVIDEADVKLAPPQDFDQLAEHSVPQNYLALVYIDINRLGRFLIDQAAESSATFRKHSNRIHDTVQQGVIKGCAKLCEGLHESDTAPFEVLLLGGDDAVVMLPAHHVFQFLQTFRAVFSSEPALKDLHFSVGVVWAHHHFPIAQFLALAEELLQSAKSKPSGGFAVDYLVVNEPLAGRIGSRNKPHTRKPYSLSEFQRLSETIATWKSAGVPATKVQELYRIAYLSRHQALLDYCFLLSRLEQTHRDLFHERFPGGKLWDENGRTSAADLVELWDFVEAK